jgi:hypothetical protein
MREGSDGFERGAANDAYEMDSIPALAGPPTASSSHAKSIGGMNDRRNYAIGIGLLLIVVLLWTSSNFLTQVTLRPSVRCKATAQRVFRTCLKAVMRNHFCQCDLAPLFFELIDGMSDSVTYMNTSAFSLYLLPYLIRRKCFRGHGDQDGSWR